MKLFAGIELRPGDAVKLSNGDWCTVTERPRLIRLSPPERGLWRLVPDFIRLSPLQRTAQIMVRVRPPPRPREPGAPSTFLVSALTIIGWSQGPGYVRDEPRSEVK